MLKKVRKQGHYLRTTGLAGLAIAAAVVPTGAPATAADATAPRTDPATAPVPSTAPNPMPNASDEERAAQGDAIVVTATKRPEPLLEVPASIAAVDAVTLERKGIHDLEELSRTVPSLVVLNFGRQVPKQFLIRGVGGGDLPSTVAIYVDDTPVTFDEDSPDLKLFDVERIEVLRGPQGTLFGSSALGGAIRYVTPKPGYDGASGFARAETSVTRHGGIGYEGQAAGGLPLVAGKVGVRASGFVRRDAGWVDNVNEDTGAMIDDDANTMFTYGGRLAVGFRPSSSFEAVLSGTYQRQHRNDFDYFFTGRGVGGATPLPLFQKTARTNNFLTDRFFLPNLTLNADLGFATLTSSSSYVDRKVDRSNDFSYFIQKVLPPAGRDLTVENREGDHDTALVQELRLASHQGSPFQWLVGAYYRHTKETHYQTVPSNLRTTFPPLAGALLTPGDLVFNGTRDQRTTQFAGFGEVSLTLLDRLTLTGGLRVTDLTQKNHRVASGLFNGNRTSTLDRRTEESPVTPKASIKYDLTDRAMIYATAAKGFRQGGPNNDVPATSAACSTALAALGLSAPPPNFGSDSLWSYELGTKFATRGNRLNLRAAVYQLDWSNIQEGVTLGACGFGFILNAGKARVRGAELESSLHPGGDLFIDIGVGYTNAKLAADLVTGANGSIPVVGATKGTPLPNVPNWTVSVGVQQGLHLGGLNGYVRADLQYIGRMFSELATANTNPNLNTRPDYVLLSARAAIQRGPIEVSLFVQNLLDSDVRLSESQDLFAPGSASTVFALRPRTIGVALRTSF